MQPIQSTQTIEDLIRSLGLRVTSSRVALITTLQQTSQPLSITELAKLLEGSDMDKATIYRNIVTLQKEGLVRQVDLHQDHAYYEWNDQSDHHHLVCIKCNRIQDFSGCDFHQMEKTALKQASDFARVTEHSFELFGVCKTCDAK